MTVFGKAGLHQLASGGGVTVWGPRTPVALCWYERGSFQNSEQSMDYPLWAQLTLLQVR